MTHGTAFPAIFWPDYIMIKNIGYPGNNFIYLRRDVKIGFIISKKVTGTKYSYVVESVQEDGIICLPLHEK